MSGLVHRRLRAPTEDGTALIEPPLADIAALVAHNAQALAVWAEAIHDFSDTPLPIFITGARRALADEALRYTLAEQDASWKTRYLPDSPLLVAGHQPELFHPGVWFKNFLLSSVAQRLGGIGINLIVDTDTARSTAIRVPVRSGSQVAVESVPFDATGEVVPFEERAILDSSIFESFAERVLAAYQSCSARDRERHEPLVVELWNRAADLWRRAPKPLNLGYVLADARHWLEWRLGQQTLEIPLSNVAQSFHFRWFSTYLLTHLHRFWRDYNTALAEYRHVNHIRSNTHPVPSLQEHDDWLEAPFFVWSSKDPKRRPVFVRQRRRSLLLSDRHSVELTLDLPLLATEQLQSAEARGIKLRPRALITTMYARLVLSDLFIHGIGGAKYDELTDLIIRRFFGIEPPAYITATATFRLPIERPNVTLAEVRESARRIRELRFRPEAFLSDPLVAQDSDLAHELAALAAEKQDFLDRNDLRRCEQAVFVHLDRLNRAMHERLRPVEEAMRARHAEWIAQAKQSQLLGSREFSFVLFPSEILPARLLDLCKVLS